jgi:hypothetical protein
VFRAGLLPLFLSGGIMWGQAPASETSLPSPHGKVLFSRSGDSGTPAQAPGETAPAALAGSVTDAMRAAPAFISYDFTIHLQPATAALEVELRATVRNDGGQPLTTLPLQLSSSLHFEHIRLAGNALPFAIHRIDSDADHTGALTEAAVAPPTPLAPGAQATFTIDYSGAIAPSSGRLDRIGTPSAFAARSDWDRIGEGFSGLRGFGDVVWYPVASIPAVLGDGAKLFHEIGRQKERNSAAAVSMAITVEFAGNAPNVGVLDGHRVPLGAPASLPSASFPGVLRVSLPPTPLGFDTPSLVLATRVEAAATPFADVLALPAHARAASAYGAAAGLLDPLFRDWLGAKPASPLLLVDLPVENATPAQDGDALLLSVTGSSPSQLAGDLSGPLSHAYFHSPRAWLSEGVAGLMAVLWIERTEGRDKALERLGAGRAALALAEPGSPGSSGGQALVLAQDAVFYRTKATYVLWMLRSLVGDAALGAALRAYDPAKDTAPEYFENLLQQAVTAGGSVAGSTTGGQAAVAGSPPAPGTVPDSNAESNGVPDLHAFFKTWVYDDPGLPDLAITNVFSSRTGAGDQWLVSVEVGNSGYAEAEVPLTVHSASTATTVQVRVPARGSISRRVLLLGEPTEVDVNDGSVPEVQASAHQRIIQ